MAYLDNTGLTRLWSKCKSAFAPNSHNHNDLYYTESEVDSLIANSGGGVEFATLAEVQAIIDSYAPPIVDNPNAEPVINPTIAIGTRQFNVTNNDTRTVTVYMLWSKSGGADSIGPTNYTASSVIASGETKTFYTEGSGNYYFKAYANDGGESETLTVTAKMN